MLPTNETSFVAICASIGQQAQCCTLPVVSFPSWTRGGLIDMIWANDSDVVGSSAHLREPSLIGDGYITTRRDEKFHGSDDLFVKKKKMVGGGLHVG